jgi:hypothetical protein
MNYVDQLEKYLKKEKTTLIDKENESEKSEISSINNSHHKHNFKNNKSALEKNSDDYKSKHALGESLGVEMRNYQRLVENCLNFDNHELKNVKLLFSHNIYRIIISEIFYLLAMITLQSC